MPSSSTVKAARSVGAAESQIPSGLARLVREGPFTAMLTDLDLRLIEVAGVWCDETGMRREAMLGRPMEELFPKAAASIRESLTGVRACSDPIEVVADGQRHVFRLESGLWRHDDGRGGGILVFGRDVTAVLASRAEIERSERRLKMALDIDRSLVWERNLKTGQINLTGSLAEILPGLKDAEDLLSLVHPEDRARVDEAWKKHVRYGAPYEIEFRHLGPDGSEIWLRNVQTLVRDAEGKPEFILCL
jgi:PAS domain S-box-containing protein